MKKLFIEDAWSFSNLSYYTTLKCHFDANIIALSIVIYLYKSKFNKLIEKDINEDLSVA